MIQTSFWEHTAFLKPRDYIVIGSGITGLSAALRIKELEPKASVAVLERGMLPSGGSTKNAGFACFGSLSELVDDLQNMPEEELLNLVNKRWRGLQLLQRRFPQIDFEPCGGYELFTPNDDELFETCLNSINSINNKLKSTIDKNVFVQRKNFNEFGFRGVSHIIQNQFEGALNPGKLMRELIRRCRNAEVEIFNGAEVLNVEDEQNGVTVNTEHHQFKTKKVIVAVNGFAKKLLPELNVSPARAQVLITKPIKNLKVRGTFHYDRGYYYFRNVGDRLLLGGGRNLDAENETTTIAALTEKIQNRLDSLLREVILPDVNLVETEHRWSGIMGMGSSKKVIVKSVSDRVVCAVRLGGMGVAIGSLIGEEAAELICDANQL